LIEHGAGIIQLAKRCDNTEAKCDHVMNTCRSIEGEMSKVSSETKRAKEEIKVLQQRVHNLEIAQNVPSTSRQQHKPASRSTKHIEFSKTNDIHNQSSDEDYPQNERKRKRATCDGPVLTIGNYDGKTQTFIGFWNQCMIVASNNEWNDEVLKAQIAGSLRGDALNQLARLGSDLSEFTLEQLKETLERKFSYSVGREEAVRRLAQYQQSKDKSYFATAQDIQDLVEIAYPKHPTELRLEESLKLFVQSIKNTEVKRQLTLLYPQPVSMEEMISHAERLQRVCTLEGSSNRLDLRVPNQNQGFNRPPSKSEF
jgi:hypothetical protein